MSISRGRDKDVVHIYNVSISYDITHVKSNLKNDKNELIYKIETDLQVLKTNLWLPKGKCGGEG